MRRNTLMGLSPFVSDTPFDFPFGFGLVPFDRGDKPSKPECCPHMAVDVQEKDGNYIVEVDMPGMDKDAVSLTIEDDILTIAYEKKEEDKEEDDKGYIIRERKRHVSLKRHVALPEADEEGASAKMEDGVLTITVPKAEEKDTSKSIKID